MLLVSRNTPPLILYAYQTCAGPSLTIEELNILLLRGSAYDVENDGVLGRSSQVNEAEQDIEGWR